MYTSPLDGSTFDEPPRSHDASFVGDQLLEHYLDTLCRAKTRTRVLSWYFCDR
jgi:hypothetical protein